MTSSGTPQETAESFDLAIICWRILGANLSRTKGVLTDKEHVWIGGAFKTTQNGSAVMTITPQFQEALQTSLAPLRKGTGHASINHARKAVGQAQRFAQVIPESQPWASALWAALTAAMQASELPRKEAPPGRLPARRFATAASWFLKLLEGTILPLQRIVTPTTHPTRTAGPLGMAFDACPWGLGAVLSKNGIFTAWASDVWRPSTLARFHAKAGDPAWQTLGECLACLCALEMWAPVETPFVVFGDNIGALPNLSSLKGEGALIAIAQEIAWRKAARRWSPICVHKPSELNTLADALSRTEATGAERKPFPTCLAGIPRTAAPDPEVLWTTWAPAQPRRQKKRKVSARPRKPP